MHTEIDYEAFADEVRQFATANCPEDIKELMRQNRKLTREPWSRWQKILDDHGWGAPGWPREYGGTGWNARQRYIFDEVLSECDCPAQYHHGLRHIGPVLIAYGSEEQKKRYLPGILDGTDWWCQGYSEPGAGSDLASLKTRAEGRDGVYVVQGQKIWTSHAHEADLMYTLVRTSSEDKKQKGITLLLIPLNSKGITVRPIRTIDDMHHVNEVFLDNVEVPEANRIGEEGQGWTYGKYLLSHERLGAANTAPLFQMFRGVRRLVENELAAPGDRRRRERHMAVLAEIEAQLRGLREQGRIAVDTVMKGEALGIAPSAIKLLASNLIQKMSEISVDIVGPAHAAAYYDANDDPALMWLRNYFLHRSSTIVGGTNEVQKNLIARDVFGT